MAKVYELKITSCQECPNRHHNVCSVLEKYVKTAIHSKSIDKDCPLDEYEKKVKYGNQKMVSQS